MNKRLTTRSLMACAVFGATSAVFVWLAIFLNPVMSGTLPWLAFPAPTPFFIGSLLSVLVIRKAGVATLAGAITTIIGYGAMALLAGLFVELVAFLGKRLLVPVKGNFYTARTFIWALLGGAAGGAGIASGIFMVAAARESLSWELLLLGSVIKILIGMIYGTIGYWIARTIFAAGTNPQGLVATP